MMGAEGPTSALTRIGAMVRSTVRDHEIPGISEPLFSKVKATIEMFPVMNQDDLQKGLQQLG